MKRPPRTLRPWWVILLLIIPWAVYCLARWYVDFMDDHL